ncbi:hypothetical protein COLO4_16064 [Corchorus olitorius]|uniref:Uncharacterized protein n=1 Tax=Corchorus olitorius TaxID=93759 RepID=A0A1R3JJR7_9ROSI|nr:hypothetical protein COLO4_16064 [Corchorus olitorius]
MEVISKQTSFVAGDNENMELNESHRAALEKSVNLPREDNFANLIGPALADREGIRDNQAINRNYESEGLFKLDGPIYGNMPGLRPSDMGLGVAKNIEEQSGKCIRTAQVDHDAHSSSLPIDPFISNQKGGAALKSFVFGFGMEKTSHSSWVRKVTGRVMKKYSFETLVAEPNVKEGRKRISIQREVRTAAGGSTKRSRDGVNIPNARLVEAALDTTAKAAMDAAHGGVKAAAGPSSTSKNPNFVMEEIGCGSGTTIDGTLSYEIDE